MEKSSVRGIALGAFAFAFTLASCAGPKAEWHPEQDGIGIWYDSSTSKLAILKKSEYSEGTFELLRFSLDPDENRMSYIDFIPKGEDSFACPDAEELVIKIDGPSMVFDGVYTDGTSFTESYQAVNKAFIAKKILEMGAKLAPLAKKKDPDIMDMQRMGSIEMIVETLKGIALPR